MLAPLQSGAKSCGLDRVVLVRHVAVWVKLSRLSHVLGMIFTSTLCLTVSIIRQGVEMVVPKVTLEVLNWQMGLRCAVKADN